MDGQGQRFTQALQALYAAAGSPHLSDIVKHDGAQVRPAGLKDATMSDWLAGAVPSNHKARAFAVLTTLLEQLASQRPGHVRRSAVEWEDLRAAAHAEKQAGRRRQPAGSAPAESPPVGVPLGLCDPLDLEVHPAGDGPGRDAAARLPGYVRRAHDEALAAVVEQAVAGRSAMAVLVGSSSTGKTRACWEAVQPLARAEPGWRLWHPFDPTRAKAALGGLEAVAPHTVVWLNDAQHYLDAGEEVAAALHRLLTDPDRRPVLVLGTLWPEHESRYAAPPARGEPDPQARARALLAGRRITVPEKFDAVALSEARELAEGGDRLLAAVLGRRHEGRVAQHLAGAPELLARYHGVSPEARALLDAAVDARRLGAGLYLPLAFLAGAAPGYLDRDAYDALADDWLAQALAELAGPVHGNVAALHRAREYPDHRPPGTTPAPAFAPAGPFYRLADYLEQHGRRERRLLCPPASFWYAAHTHLTDPEDLRRLADASRARHRLQWADALYHRAANAGNTDALARLAEMRMDAEDRDGAEALYRRAADAGNTEALVNLAWMWPEQAGDRDGAEALYRRAADAGNTEALLRLAEMRKGRGEWDDAEAVYHRAADAGSNWGLAYLAEMREQAGDREGAEALCRRAADAGNTEILVNLAWKRQNAGDRDGAEALYRRATDAGNNRAATWLAKMREEAGDREGAEALYRRAADAGENEALLRLTEIRERAGDRDGAQAIYQHAADAGNSLALAWLAEMRERAGDRDGAEALCRRATDGRNSVVLTRLAKMREKIGDREGAEALYLRATDAGDTDAPTSLAEMREKAGDLDGAEALRRYGLEPDGTLASPWPWSRT